MKAKSMTLLLTLVCGTQAGMAEPMGTAFTYQGHLTDGGNAATGLYDFRFTVYDSLTNGTQWGSLISRDDCSVSNGFFTVELDFTAFPFNGDARWLQISVRPGESSTSYAALHPRQPLRPSPYALHTFRSESAATLTGTVGDWQLSASIPRLYASQTFNSTNHFSPPGGPPFTVGNSTRVPNLNADLLDGVHAFGFWQLGGNAGTTAGTHFVGTADEEALEFKVENKRALRLESTAFESVNVIGGAAGNSVDAGTGSATIGGGLGNSIGANAWNATIAGGTENSIGDNSGSSYVGGGQANSIHTNSTHAVIGGGQSNHIIDGDYAVLAGGVYNWIGYDCAESVIDGGYQNVIGDHCRNAVIGGGCWNLVGSNSTYSVVAGGQNNTVHPGVESGTVSGGGDNEIRADGDYATISGGYHNIIEPGAHDSTIGGGLYNLIDEGAHTSAIAGGANNFIDPSAVYATIGGGLENTVLGSGAYGTIAGGRLNEATNYAFAAGRRAKARHTGSFVWADSENADFVTSSADQFCIRAAGGVHLDSGTSQYFGSTLRQMVNLWGTSYGLGVQNSTFYSRSADRFCWYRNGQHTNSAVNPGAGGTWLMTLDGGGALFTAGGVYPSSDRNLKTKFEPVETGDVLDRVLALPIQTWSYKSEGSVRHMGPVAQDFRVAFTLGKDDKHIATVDADGVALAAIQGLHQKFERELQQKDARIAELKARIEKLEQVLERGDTGGAR